jgi:8-oxo-dGTP pyrophosphatase MutT (NUDIX family)
MLGKRLEWLLGLLLVLFYGVRLIWWRITRPVTLNARALVVDGDQLLLVRGHGSQHWHLPGGGVKRYESLAEAARREVFEETGCQIAIDGLLGIYVNYAEYKSEHIGIFVAHPVSGLSMRRNIEIAEARFFPLRNPPVLLVPSVRARLDDYLNKGWGMTGPWDPHNS